MTPRRLCARPFVPVLPASRSVDGDRSALVGAFSDRTTTNTREDRGAGIVHGTRERMAVTGNVRTRAERGARVDFSTTGAASGGSGRIVRLPREDR